MTPYLPSGPGRRPRLLGGVNPEGSRGSSRPEYPDMTPSPKQDLGSDGNTVTHQVPGSTSTEVRITCMVYVCVCACVYVYPCASVSIEHTRDAYLFLFERHLSLVTAVSLGNREDPSGVGCRTENGPGNPRSDPFPRVGRRPYRPSPQTSIGTEGRRPIFGKGVSRQKGRTRRRRGTERKPESPV